MVLHRATTISHSAAESRFRNDGQSTPHYNSILYPHDIAPNSEFSNSLPPRRPSLFISLNYPQNETTLQREVDPTQPLLPTTRFHAQVESNSLSASNHPADLEQLSYRRMPLKASSGTYIGLLCVAVVWLLPIGIIISGGMGGDVVAQVVRPLFGRMMKEFPIIDSSSLKPLMWENVKRGEHCLRYKTREYTARSISSGRGQEGIEECENSSAQIHDIDLRPSFCEDLGRGGIWGHWVVDFSEPECETGWVDFTDEGCQAANGRRRFTATLDRFNTGDNWLIMCSTTPSKYLFRGEPLPVPTNCQRVQDVVIGMWEVPDRSCKAV